MDDLLLDPLNSLTTSLNTLISSLTTTNTFSTAVPATQSLLSADDALTSALATLKTHQQNYARTLHLRAEAARLESQIKDVVRMCGEFRSEIGAIHPNILEDSDTDSEDEDDGEVQEIDYTTLLSLASRIGKYNTSAAREAEEESIRLQIAGRSAALRITNGNGNSNSNSNTAVAHDPGADTAAATNAQISMDRAMRGMAFPDANILRNGALGQLQLIREQGGEEAVEREVERMVRESEGTGLTDPGQDVKMEEDEVVVPAQSQEPSRPEPSQVRTRRQSSSSRPSQMQERKKLSLDMWNEDDDDDDD